MARQRTGGSRLVSAVDCSLCCADPAGGGFVAGAGVYICHPCVAAAAAVIATGQPTASIEAVDAGSDKQCRFCGKGRLDVAAMASTADGGVCVCVECIQLCRELIEEAGA